jgi:hypothetical protein
MDFSPNKGPAKPAQESRPFVYAVNVSFPDMSPKKVEIPKTMKQFLRDLTDALELKRPATQLYDSALSPFPTIDSIPPKAVVQVSSASSPKPRPQSDVLSRARERPLWPELPLPSPVKPPEVPELPADYEQRVLIAGCDFTVRDAMRDAILAVFCAVSENERYYLGSRSACEGLLRKTQDRALLHAMLQQSIGPTSNILTSEYGKATMLWAAEKLNGVKPENCRIVIRGDSQSGKSTLLFLAVLAFFEKVNLIDQGLDYLIVPFNWDTVNPEIETLPGLFELFIRVTFDALRALRPRLIPVISCLVPWFLGIFEHSGLPILPRFLQSADGVAVGALQHFAREIHRAYYTPAELDTCLGLITDFPCFIAQAFGLTSAVYVHDHFDITSTILLGPEPLSSYLGEAARDCPFFITSKNDDDFVPGPNLGEFTEWSTSGIIQDENDWELWVVDRPISLTFQECEGCPAYCAIYNRICRLAATAEENAISKSYSRYESTIDHTTDRILSEEFLRLLVLVGDPEKWSTENSLAAPFKVNVRARASNMEPLCLPQTITFSPSQL